MDKLQVLALKKSVTVYEAAQLLARGNGGVREWEALIIESIELRELAANVKRWKDTDYWNGDRDGGISQMETTLQRADLDQWLTSKGLSIGLVTPAAVLPTPTPQAAPETETVAPAADRTKPDAPMLSMNAIPGNLPKIAVAIIAIQTAWSLECELRRRPSRKEVMERLRELANGKKTETLQPTDARVKGVNWMTEKGDVKNYSSDALGKALSRWYRSRQ